MDRSNSFDSTLSTDSFGAKSRSSSFDDAEAIHDDHPVPSLTELDEPVDTQLGITINSRFSSLNPTSIAKLSKRIKDGNNVGLEGILSAIDTNIQNGIIGDSNDIEERRQAFGSNLVSEDHIINLVYYFGHFAWESIKDLTILMLFACSVLSLGFGIQKNGLKQGWQEGVARFSAIVAAILISSAGNFWPTYQSLITSEESSRIPKADVLRKGSWLLIEICDVVVGDIVFLKPGDQVPGDGLFIEGCGLHVESQGAHTQAPNHDVNPDKPHLSFGDTVLNGYAKMVVTAVGKNKKMHTICFKGKLLDEMAELEVLAGKIVRTIGWTSFAILLYDFLVGGYYDNKGGNVWPVLVRIVATSFMIVLTSKPDGLVLAVKIGFAYAMKKMMEINVLVRDPSMCHSAASITTLCINKTGTLTHDSMEVAEVFQWVHSIKDGPIDSISSNICELLHQGIGLNTLNQAPFKSSIASTGSSADKAIHDWAVKHLGMNTETLNGSYTILEVSPFPSKFKSSGILISKNTDNTLHVHRKGAPDAILQMCSHYYESNGTAKLLNRNVKASFETQLKNMTEKGLRCLAFAHRKTSITEYFAFTEPKHLVLLGFVGMKNKPRDETKRIVQECKRASINLKLITGDSLLTAGVIAKKCGILEAQRRHQEMMEGKYFRSLSPEERMARVEHIRVLASATPDDKLLMVQCLKQKRHVVGYLGQGMGDVMALREANVALCFGTGTKCAEIAKACMGLVLTCKDIYAIVHILKWGRSLYDSIQAYTKFLITSTFVALILEFVTMFASDNYDALTQFSKGRAPYPVFPLLWAKLINGTFSALVLIIKPPKEGVMRKPPRSRKHLLITPHIWTQIYLQVLSQLTILLCIHFKATSLFLVNTDVKQAMIFNTYILFQVFAMLDATIFDATFSDKIDVIEEIYKNRVSFGIILLLVFVQVLMLGVLKKCADTAALSWGLWAACIIMAASYWLVSLLVKNFTILKKIFKWPYMKLKAM